MATVDKFSTRVNTSEEAGEYVSWINRLDLPVKVLNLLNKMDSSNGVAWAIREDRWINPVGWIVDTREHVLAYNDVTVPRLVNGDVDYSAWDD